MGKIIKKKFCTLLISNKINKHPCTKVLHNQELFLLTVLSDCITDYLQIMCILKNLTYLSQMYYQYYSNTIHS